MADLGALDGPVLVFGGTYGNLEATQAFLAAARGLGIAAGNTICTGDVVAYGADPQAVSDLLREWGCAIVMGNCEEALAAEAADCGCGFDEGSACAALSAQWFAATRRDLDPATKRWMGGLPRRIVFTLVGRRIAAIHGGAAQINRFVFPSTPAADKAAEIDATGTDGVIAGHCGIPFSEIVGGRLWHNSGAIGMPANDGTARVWYALLSPVRGGIEVTHRALDYDHRGAAAKMRARGYPASYADALGSGLWPSCDVLPAAELAERGRALIPGSMFWPFAALPQAAE
ncbi:MAG: metallophosphoesterase family protein [Rhodospirillales bacterium]|nr:metallophosphoesterase family protein [Rhodospirillales bacterium]